MYHISPYSYNRARQLNVEIRPSTHKGKKIDVFKNNIYLCSIGAVGYNDYTTYLRDKGLEYATKRRFLYRKRHQNDKSVAGFYAREILW